MHFPGKLFWTWSLYAVLKSLFTGALLGGLWVIATVYTFDQGTLIGNLGYMLSFLVDSTFVYWIVLLAACQGFSLHTWDVFGALLHDARRMFLTQYLVAALVSLVAGFALRFIYLNIGYSSNGEVPAFYAMIVTFTVAASFAYATAFRGYMLYVVMDSKDRREYVRQDNDRRGITRLTRMTFPWIDRNRMSFTVIQCVLIVALGVQVSATVGQIYEQVNLFPIVLGSSLALVFCIWAWLLRFWDSVRPGKKNETLYPHFEDYR